MVITISSIFRDSMKYLESRYFPQVTSLWPVEDTRWVFVEGDSGDKTYERLLEFKKQYPYQCKVIKRDTFTPRYGSVEKPERYIPLKSLVNEALDHIHYETDYLIWVESDLIVPPGTIDRLIAVSGGTKISTPYIFHDGAKTFYDTWAFRKNDIRFVADYPYHPEAKDNEPFEVDSAGSMLCVPIKYINRGARYVEEPPAIVGFCKRLRDLGGEIWADPTTIIYHPV